MLQNGYKTDHLLRKLTFIKVIDMPSLLLLQCTMWQYNISKIKGRKLFSKAEPKAPQKLFLGDWWSVTLAEILFLYRHTLVFLTIYEYYGLTRWPSPSWFHSSVGSALYPFRPQFFSNSGFNFLRLIMSSCTFLLPIQQQSSRINSYKLLAI